MKILSSAKKVLIIEPHPDDAWLNLGAWLLIKLSEVEVKIVTVCSRGKGVSAWKRTEMLKKFVNNLDCKELCYTNLEDNTNVSDKKEKLKLRDKITDLEMVFTSVNYKGDVKSANELISKLLEEGKGYDVVLLPMGYKNPNHNLIMQVLGNKYSNVLYYREFPYYWNKAPLLKNCDYIYPKFEEVEYCEYDKDIIDMKWRIMQTVYNDQMGMMWFCRPYYKKIKSELLFKFNWKDGEFYDNHLQIKKDLRY